MDSLPSERLIPVPQSLSRVFGLRKIMLDLAYRATQLKCEVLTLKDEPGAAKLDLDATCRLLDQLQTMLGNAVPYAQCNCYPNRPCPLCNGMKWLSAGDFLATLSKAQHSKLRASSKHRRTLPVSADPSITLPALPSNQGGTSSS